MSTWRLRGNDLLVRAEALRERELAGGLVLHVRAQKESTTGTIVQRGPGLIREDGSVQPLPAELAIGARIIYNKFTQFEITVDGEDLYVIDADDALVVLDDEDVYQAKGKALL